MSISIYIIDKVPIKYLLVLIGIGFTTHLLRLKTLTKDEMIALEEMRRQNLEAN